MPLSHSCALYPEQSFPPPPPERNCKTQFSITQMPRAFICFHDACSLPLNIPMCFFVQHFSASAKSARSRCSPALSKRTNASFDKYYPATCNGLRFSLAKPPTEISSKVSIKAEPVQSAGTTRICQRFWHASHSEDKMQNTMTQMPPACSIQALLGPFPIQPD